MSLLEVQETHSSSSQTAESYARSLGAKVTLRMYHATADRFPTREAFNLFVKFLETHDYRFRLANSVSTDVSFSMKPASHELRKLADETEEVNDFVLGRI